MGLRCKVGDIAVIVDPTSPNYSKLVSIRAPHRGERCPAGFRYEDDGLPAWLVDSLTSGGLVIVGGFGPRGPFAWSVINDCALRPLRGDLTDDTTHTDTPLSSPAQPVTAG